MSAFASAGTLLAVGCGEGAGSTPTSRGDAGASAVSGASSAGSGAGTASGGASGIASGGSSATAGGSAGTTGSGGAASGGASGNGGGGRAAAGSSSGGAEAAAAGGVGGSSGAPAAGAMSGGDGGGAAGGEGGSAGSGASGGCVDVAHVDSLQRDDLRVIGSGFEADEGQLIRVMATHGEPTYGLGEAAIEGGAFDIFLPGVLGDYTGLAIYIDIVRDDACNPGDEFIWQMTTGPAAGNIVWRVTPLSLRTFDQVGPCSLNGIFDLTLPLHCPAE